MQFDIFKIFQNKNITFINPYSYLILRKKRDHYLFCNDFIFCLDGFMLVWVLKIFGVKNIVRLSFDDSSLAPLVFQNCIKSSQSIGLIGSAPNIAHLAKELLEKRYQNINIIYYQDGFFKETEQNEVLNNAFLCDVIICSMGTPNQEDFLYKLRKKGWNGTGYTCGGYLDQLVNAQGKDYYPKLIDKLNLRWLYRIYKEPRRLLLRYLFDYPIGIIAFIFDIFIRKKKVNIK